MQKYTLGELQNLHTICCQTAKWLLPEISFRIRIQFTDWITLRSIIPWNFLTELFCKWPVCHSVWNMHLQFAGKSIYFLELNKKLSAKFRFRNHFQCIKHQNFIKFSGFKLFWKRTVWMISPKLNGNCAKSKKFTYQ